MEGSTVWSHWSAGLGVARELSVIIGWQIRGRGRGQWAVNHPGMLTPIDESTCPFR